MGDAGLTDDLETARSLASAEVNRAAGELRLNWITDIPGQAMVYLQKYDEARRYLAQAILPFDLGDYPFLQAEVGVTGDSPQAVAQVIVSLGNQWTAVAVEIETARLGAVKAIREAESLAEIHAAQGAGLSAIATIMDFGG
ncbi:MAG TPA: hypothetical protein DIT40_08255 [Alphaproteobacteria bacterium]|nr:hypothetical protein [Alphaproteobacteria bacterium]